MATPASGISPHNSGCRCQAFSSYHITTVTIRLRITTGTKQLSATFIRSYSLGDCSTFRSIRNVSCDSVHLHAQFSRALVYRLCCLIGLQSLSQYTRTRGESMSDFPAVGGDKPPFSCSLLDLLPVDCHITCQANDKQVSKR